MPSNVFFDTNVIVYFSFDAGAKTARADELLRDGGIVSVQVLNEFARVATGKKNLSFIEVSNTLDAVRSTCKVVPLELRTHTLGLRYADRYKIGIYDAMIVAAAELAHCHTLYTEDMQDGMVIEGVTILNPFAR
jgi:predicted nucleic acid-binding protein